MLYIVATPIGNLEDLSTRAKRILSEVDFVLSEDTRQSSKLLNRFQIKTKLVSFHEHSSQVKLEWVISELKDGREIALITDAGTPNLSDPGGRLVEAAMGNKIAISPIPGPSALTALISIAPFACSHFSFMGYFPKKKGRQTMIKTIKNLDCPVFFYESPHRIKKTLELLSSGLPEYKILLGRELTKKFEQILFFDLNDKDIVDTINPKGEFVLALVKNAVKKR